MKKFKIILVFIVTLTIIACSKSNPVPENKLSYAGEWESMEMYLLILPDGSVSYKRLQGGKSTSVNGPIKEFSGDDFIVGFAFLTTTFNVTEVPKKVDGKWIMVVDGVTLTKNSE